MSTESNNQALQIYTNIAIRCGLVAKAEDALLKFFPKASAAQKPRILNQLIQMKLGQQLPLEAKKYIEKLGEIADPTNEQEEANYLLTYMSIGIQAEEQPDEEELKSYHKRCNDFFNRFPDSALFRSAELPKDANGEELIKLIESLAGISPEQKEYYQKNQRQLKEGKPCLFALKPKLLQNISDLYRLWAYSKINGRKTPETQLVINQQIEGWSSESSVSFSSIPLLDDLTLLVLNDLNLLKILFIVFKKIAIPKNVFYRLQYGGSAFPGSGYKTCTDILELLSQHINQIEQPSLKCKTLHSITLEEIKACNALLANNPNYIYYSDDVLCRLIVSEKDASRTMCTNDLLRILLESKKLTPVQVAEKRSLLAGWGVNGIDFTAKDIYALAMRNTSEDQSYTKNLEGLYQDEGFTQLFGSVLTEDRTLFQLVNVLGITLAHLIGENPFSQTQMSILQAIWQFWLEKISILPQAGDKLMNILLSYLSIATQLIAMQDNTTTSNILYSLYKDMFSSNAIMVEPSEAVASRIGTCDNPELRKAICDFALLGISELSMERERFNQAYVNAVASRTIRT